MKHIFFIFLLSLFASCFDARSDLEIALDLAGENLAELEKVLAHYETDPEKLAAVFIFFSILDFVVKYALSSKSKKSFISSFVFLMS